MDRADVDDAAEAAFAHAGRIARVRRRAGEHHLHEKSHFHGEFLQRRDVLQAGVVDQHPRPGATPRPGRRRRCRRVTSSASASAEPPASRIRRRRLRGIVVDVGDDEVVASARQFGGTIPAPIPAASAGDQDAAMRVMAVPARACAGIDISVAFTGFGRLSPSAVPGRSADETTPLFHAAHSSWPTGSRWRNAFCGTGAVFAAMRFCKDGNMRDLLWGMALIPLAFVFDACARRPHRALAQRSPPLGRELDSLADVPFGVAPAALGYACGLQGGWNRWCSAISFVGCGVSRLAQRHRRAAFRR